jgi:selenocysteine lyase/cysteine desulfurase
VEDSGGMVRVGAAHYNTLKEVEQLKEILLRISAGSF